MSGVKIDEQYNVVIPIRRPGGMTIWVHSQPIPTEMFANFYLPIAETFNILFQKTGMVPAPRIAYFALRDVCMKDPSLEWDGEQGVNALLCDVIWQRTNVLIPGVNHWDLVPFHDCMRRTDWLTPREIQEVQNAVIFFTVNYHMHSVAVMRALMMMSQRQWDVRLTLLSCTAFRDSSEILTDNGNFGETEKT